MTISPRVVISMFLTSLFVITSIAAQDQSGTVSRSPQNNMPGMGMGDAHRDGDANIEAAKSANDAMSGHDMSMNAHMFMTELRPRNAADDQRAAEIVEVARKSIAKYRDYKLATADGFRVFMPNVPQPLYHFTNYGYGYLAEFKFDPALPTSLLYKKTQDGYELVGAMYTAPRNSTEDQLNERVPLSAARWHKHVNLCLPQKGMPIRDINWQEFGFAGSIITKDACQQANGRWFPQIFNWMVHVYPFESDPRKLWAR